MLLCSFLLFASISRLGETLKCVQSTTYEDKMLEAPVAVECQGKVCVKTMQLSTQQNNTKLLAIHRECYEHDRFGEEGCTDTYNGTKTRRTGPRLITCFCSEDWCNF
ncbi:unnamed protein product [Caenorhabditis auriculariae]|uniref:Activin types I and II receptor domain-containing protein n=1 Tax=Caenorhabditis auriculariae TaxID=2777116 RepID=A0A8S1GVF1_9PELO|nr:unnamed protein product [Caenorhabditis auriculariae]